MGDFKHPVQEAVEAQTRAFTGEEKLGKQVAGARFLRVLWRIAFICCLLPFVATVVIRLLDSSTGLDPGELWKPLALGAATIGTGYLAIRSGRGVRPRPGPVEPLEP